MLEGKYPCWCCGKHYITVLPDTDYKDSDNIFKFVCPECGKLTVTSTYCASNKKERILSIKEAILRHLKEVPLDPEARKSYFAESQREKQCDNNCGERFWGGGNEEFYICPTSYYDGNTICIGSWGNCVNLTVGEARVLRDKLDEWLK